MFTEAKDDESGGDNWTPRAIRRAKLQSNHHHQQTNTQLFYRPDALYIHNNITVRRRCTVSSTPSAVQNNSQTHSISQHNFQPLYSSWIGLNQVNDPNITLQVIIEVVRHGQCLFITSCAACSEKKKKISQRLSPLRGSSSPFWPFEPARVKPN